MTRVARTVKKDKKVIGNLLLKRFDKELICPKTQFSLLIG